MHRESPSLAQATEEIERLAAENRALATEVQKKQSNGNGDEGGGGDDFEIPAALLVRPEHHKSGEGRWDNECLWASVNWVLERGFGMPGIDRAVCDAAPAADSPHRCAIRMPAQSDRRFAHVVR